MGVTQEKGKFRARVSVNGKRISLGRFDTRLKAQQAITDYHEERAFEKKFDETFNRDVRDEEPYFNERTGLIIPEEPTFFERIKSIWQSIRQRS